MKRNNFLFFGVLLIISSCASIESEVVVTEGDKLNVVDENQIFIKYLEDEWEKTLNKNPLFATYTGDKRANDKINSNSIAQFNKSKELTLRSFNLLKQINVGKLNKDNQLNYQLLEFDLKNDIYSNEFPTYYLRLNQRGGIQSFYETGNRLVYSSKQDYLDWLTRLDLFSQNILNSYEINKEGLAKGHTQPKLVTIGVISQIERIINSDIESNPYLKVFLEADETL